ncbi:MAG: hypothetical protein AAF799_40115 [Myxococcota bacterium]
MAQTRFGYGGETLAVLVAGRALSHEATHYTVGMVELMIELAERNGHAVVVPDEDLDQRRKEEGPDAPLSGRVAIGVKLAVATSDSGRPLAAPSIEDMRAAVARADEVLDPFFWRRLGQIIKPAAIGFTGAQMRAAAAENGLPDLYDGMALDPKELAEQDNGLLLAVCGPLPCGTLWYGRQHTPKHPYMDPDGEEEWDQLFEANPGPDHVCFGAGQGPGQDPHTVWVEGVRVAYAAYDSLGVVPVDVDPSSHAAREAAIEGISGAGYQLISRYD